MLRILTTKSKLMCSHGAGEVQLGPGADWFLVDDFPALRVVDVLNRPVQKCPYCKTVVTVQYGEEDCLTIGAGEDGTEILTELAFGTTNAGAWRVVPASAWSVQIALAASPPHSPPPPRSKPASPKEADTERADLSGPLALLEWQTYHCPKPKPESFEPDRHPLDADGREVESQEPLAGKWLYVFTVDRRNKRQLFKEYWITETGLAQAVKNGPRTSAHGPAPDLDTAQDLRLPLERGGKLKRYAFLASRRRLPARSVRRCTGCLEVPSQEVGPKPAIAYATDPLTVADHLSARYRQYRDRFVAAAAGLTPDGTTLSRDGQRVMLARLLTPLLEKEDLKLADELTDGGKPIALVLRTHEKDLENLQVKSEEAAEQLIRWLQGPLWAATVEAYVAYPAADFEVLFPVFARCLERLLETGPGRDYGLTLLKNKRHFVHEFVSRTKAGAGEIVQVARKTPEAIVPVWELGMLWSNTPHFEPRAYVRSLLLVFADEEVVIARGREKLRLHRFAAAAVEFDYIDMVEVPNRLKHAMRWLNDNERVERLVNGYKGAFEALNLGMAVWGLKQEGSIKNYVEVIGASVDALKEFGRQAGWDKKVWRHVTGKQLMAGLGMASAICDIIGGITEFRKARSNNDPHVAAGWMAYTVGSALLLVAETGHLLESLPRFRWILYFRAAVVRLGAAGLRLATSVPLGASVARIAGPVVARVPKNIWTLLGAALVLAGVVYVAARKKKSLQLFAFNCEWGKATDRTDDRPDWAVVSFNKWPGNIDLQLESLFHLLAAFRLTAAGFHKLLIEPVLTMPGTTIEVVGQYTNHEGRRCQPGYRYHWGEKRAEQLPGYDADDLALVKVDDAGRGLTVEIRGATPQQSAFAGGPLVTVWVRLDLLGDNLLPLPGKSAWLRYDLFEFHPNGSAYVSVPILLPNSQDATSLDIDCLQEGPKPPEKKP